MPPVYKIGSVVSIAATKKEFTFNLLKNIENNFKFTLVNVESMDKVEIYPHIKNIKKFYDMLK